MSRCLCGLWFEGRMKDWFCVSVYCTVYLSVNYLARVANWKEDILLRKKVILLLLFSIIKSF